MTAGIPAYEAYAQKLLAELSEEDRKTLAKYEAAGNYEAVVQHPGFHTLRQTGIELQIEQTARLEFKLEVGALSESVFLP